MKEVKFATKSESVASVEATAGAIKKIAMDLYGVQIDLGGLDVGQYYLDSGAKITKALRSRLIREGVDKASLEPSWSAFCKAVSALYADSEEYLAEIRPAEELGNGIWESGSTCFGDSGLNSHHKRLVGKRLKVLAITRIGGKDLPEGRSEKVGRCIMFLAGRRNIYLFNFYFKNGATASKTIFVLAARKLLGLERIKYAPCKLPFVPVYRNAGPLRLYDERSGVPNPTAVKFPCAHCGKLIAIREATYLKNGNHSVYACSREHAFEILPSNMKRKCTVCGRWWFSSDTRSVYSETGNADVCVGCIPKKVRACSLCGGFFLAAKTSETVCHRCRPHTCANCGSVALPSTVIRTKQGSKHFCDSCIGLVGGRCDVCLSAVQSGSTPLREIVHGGQKFRVCAQCKNDLHEVAEAL